LSKPSLLLHSCCAPCSSHVIDLLSSEWNITSFFYNPNISPVKEYNKRLNELKRFSVLKSFQLIEGGYDNKRWTEAVKRYRHLGEKSARCRECFNFRLEKVFSLAAEKGMDAVATVLSISPHKDTAVINSIGIDLEKKYGVRFVAADFKKNNGFKHSLELSRQHDFYRQKYCGCGYSRLERDPNSPWSIFLRKNHQSRPQIKRILDIK
jgi:epoxyqueuosine reductase